jgi:hypothetical protein
VIAGITKAADKSGDPPLQDVEDLQFNLGCVRDRKADVRGRIKGVGVVLVETEPDEEQSSGSELHCFTTYVGMETALTE